jgi:hypothetical protein
LFSPILPDEPKPSFEISDLSNKEILELFGYVLSKLPDKPRNEEMGKTNIPPVSSYSFRRILEQLLKAGLLLKYFAFRYIFKPPALFDKQWYLAQNEDVARSGIDPYYHYLKHGWKDGRNPSKLFDVRWYVTENLAKGINEIEPMLHYLKYGWKQGKSPSQDFDSQWYLNNYPDVRAAGIEPLTHYLLYGKEEGRTISHLEFN